MGEKKKGRPVGDFLEPLTGTIKRRKFGVIDIESKAGDPNVPTDHSQKAGFVRPFLVGLYDPREGEYQEFRNEPHLFKRSWVERHWQPGGCIDKLLCVILQKKYSGWTFYSHNGGSFDELFLLAWLRNHLDEFGFEVVPVQSSIQVIRVWRLPDDPDLPIREKWEFLDSMKLLPFGLEKACQTFGLPGKVQHDLHMHEDDPQWSVYLKQDCIALATVLTKLYDMVEHKLGGEVGMTAPSTSMKLFRRRFLGRDGTPNKLSRYAHFTTCKNKEACPGCAHNWVRRGYYGGRTELFRTFGENLHYYDINSSYVAAMREHMPVGERMVEDKLDWSIAARGYAGFVECEVFVPPECEIPPLPHRDKKTGKLLFPAGYFRGVWSTEELKLLQEPMVGGKITRVFKVVWFRLMPLFGKMVDELYRLRDKRLPGYDEGLSALAKLLGNSLYGKFGMKQERTSVVFTRPPKENACFLCGEPASTGGLCMDCQGSTPASGDPTSDVWYQAKKVDAPYIMPQIAAHITALARIRIWRFMKQALDAGGKLYYTDTDSIITDAVLPSSSELGALKDEYPDQELRGSFLQPKVYMLENPKLNAELDEIAAQLEAEADPHGLTLPVAVRTEANVKALVENRKVPDHFKPKVTMKGFARELRTKENLRKLEEGMTLESTRLEKVRTLASEGFRRGPQMAVVKKSFKSRYDKRRLHPDGSTSAVVLDERDFDERAAE